MDGFFRRAAWECIKAALVSAAFCLFAEAIFAVIIRSATPSETVITAVNWTIGCLGIFVSSLLFIRKERSFFKGLAAGALSAVVTMLLFAAIGGGFRLDVLFLPELVLYALCGGLGALSGAKLRKE